MICRVSHQHKVSHAVTADDALLAVGQRAVCWQYVFQRTVQPSPASCAGGHHLGHHVWFRSQSGADAVH